MDGYTEIDGLRPCALLKTSFVIIGEKYPTLSNFYTYFVVCMSAVSKAILVKLCGL